MKKQLTFFKYLFAFVIVLGVSSCSSDDSDLTNNQTENFSIAAKNSSAQQTTESYVATEAPEGCETCVQAPVEQLSTQTITWGNGKTKDVSVTAWNDNEKFYLKINSTVNINGVQISYPYTEEGGNNHVDYNYTYSELTATEITYEFDLEEGWASCNAQDYAVRVEGPGTAAEFGKTTYNLFEICSCEDLLTYTSETVDGLLQVEFTYISAETIENAEIKFTFPHISGFTSNDGKEYSVNNDKNPNQPTVLTYVGDLESCKEITFSLTLTPYCNQGNSDKATIWTDFKVNEVSKKGTNENIVFNCAN